MPKSKQPKECIICGRPSEGHHWFSRGSLRGDAELPENVVRLCRIHHTKVHAMGRETFAKLYHLEKLVDFARQAIYNRYNIKKLIEADSVEDVPLFEENDG